MSISQVIFLALTGLMIGYSLIQVDKSPGVDPFEGTKLARKKR